MLIPRLIPCLLLGKTGLVKTRRFRDPKYVGDPINAVHIFNEKEVDELMLLDISSSRDDRGPNFELIEQIAGECFMPLCYGGGIRSLGDARKLFKLGVEKVALQSGFFQNSSLLRQIADHAGEQAVVASIDVARDWLGRRKVRSGGGAKAPESKWQDMVRIAVDNGAGEVLLNCVERDGTLLGPDLGLVHEASSLVDVPLIAAGGIGSLEDVRAAVAAGASAVAAGAFFVFYGPHRAVLITYPRYGEIEALWTHAA